MQTQVEKQVAALMEAYTTLRAVFYAYHSAEPVIAKMCADSARQLTESFPALRQLESFIRLGESELAGGKTDEGEKGTKFS